MMNNNENIKGHIYAIICVIIWGISGIFTKTVANDFSRFTVLAIEYGISYFGLWIFFNHKIHKLTFKEELIFFLAGLFGTALYGNFQVSAYASIPASIASVLINTSPIMIAILSLIFYKEKITKHFIVGFFIAITGIFLVSFNGVTELNINPQGIFYALMAALSYSIYTLFLRQIHKMDVEVPYITRHTHFYGMLCLIPIYLMSGDKISFDGILQTKYIFSIIFLGFIMSLGSNIIWNKAMMAIGAVRASVYIYAISAVSVVSSAIVLKEKITIMLLAGIALTILGVVISGMKDKNE